MSDPTTMSDMSRPEAEASNDGIVRYVALSLRLCCPDRWGFEVVGYAPQMSLPQPTAPRLTRGERSRIATRARLVAAGRRVFAEKGVVAASITDIAETADVGRGSFYNFFQSKEELVEAITAEVGDELVRIEQTVAEMFTDQAEALVAILHCARTVLNADETMAWFAVRVQAIGGTLYNKFHAMLCGTLERGRDAGRFSYADTELAYVMISGLFTAGHSARMLDVVKGDFEDEIIEAILKVLGIPSENAHSLATRADLRADHLLRRINFAISD